MSWLVSLVRPLVAAALLGATLGGLGAMGYFFWANREMCPCAPVGLEGVEQVVSVPMSSGVRDGVWHWSAVGAAASLFFASFMVIPQALRLRRVELDEPDS